MRNITRCATGLAMAAVLFLSANTAHALNEYWPNGQPYACTYQLQNGSKGVALVTISLGAGSYARSGSVTNLYPNASTLMKPLTVAADIQVYGGDFGWRAGEGASLVTCLLTTDDDGRHLTFHQCSNGTLQDCRQW
jgi:hypothetical protein